MNDKTFVLSDESVNRYGFIVLNSAIDLERFRRNPVMCYNHDYKQGAIGRWKNLRFENGQLIGEPVFDEKNVFAKEIKRKVDEGFIKSASIGFNANEEDINSSGKYPVFSKIDLIEISICDIPGNKNAIALYDKNKKKVNDIDKYLKVKLNINFNNDNMNEFLTNLGKLLGLENPTEESILAAVEELVKQVPDTVEEKLSYALRMRLVNKDELKNLRKLGKANPMAFAGYISDLDKKCQSDLDTRIDDYFRVNYKKFSRSFPEERADLKAFARRDFDLFVRFMNAVPEQKTWNEMIEEGRKEKQDVDRSEWTLSDYRKKDPEALRKDPELYQRLIEESKEK